jgi:hypothetical protein
MVMIEVKQGFSSVCTMGSKGWTKGLALTKGSMLGKQ